MRKRLQIIVSCTDRKRHPVPDELRLRAFLDAQPAKRARRWWSQLSSHASDLCEAEVLYLGDHWTVARELPTLADQQGFRATLWVASAGYGLIPAHAPIRSYSATFVAGHPDSVAPASNGIPRHRLAATWWSRLSSFEGPDPAAPRTIAELLGRDPTTYVVVVASPDYVLSMEDDIVDALRASRDPDRFIIVTSPVQFSTQALAQHVVPSVARLQALLGGTRQSLHARTARKILSELGRWPLSASGQQQRYLRLLARCPEAPTFERRRLTDEQVLRFIRGALRRSPELSCSRLLRSLRDGGRACEQGRFRDLYMQVRGEV